MSNPKEKEKPKELENPKEIENLEIVIERHEKVIKKQK